ncbi:hypothetical protein ES703_79659 [subsurface metagenome]
MIAHDVYSSGLCPVVVGHDRRGNPIRCQAEIVSIDGVVKCDDYGILADYGGGLCHVHSPP